MHMVRDFSPTHAVAKGIRLLLVLLTLVSFSRAGNAGEVTYVFSAGPTREWVGGAPEGFPGTNPVPNHDAFSRIEIPRFHVPGTVYRKTIYRALLQGSASHNGFAVAQLFSFGSATPHPSLPGGINYGVARDGFVREFSAGIENRQVNATGDGDFLRNWRNDSGLVGTDVGQTHTAIAQVAARLRPPNSEYYATKANISAKWYVTHIYDGAPKTVEPPDKFKIPESEKARYLLQAKAYQAYLDANNYPFIPFTKV